MAKQLIIITFLTVTCAVAMAIASPACAPFSDAAEQLPLEYLDRADPMVARATQNLVDALLAAQIAEPEAGGLQKHYCRIGMSSMVVRFVQPALEDAIAAVVTQATYAWYADQEPAGWVLANMQRHPMCARGPETFATLCN